MTAAARLVSYRLDPALVAAMKALQQRDGIPQSEQVRRALRAWLEERGVLDPLPRTGTARKRVAPRSRA